MRCKELYAQRGCIIEPIFGQGKDVRGGRRFMRRGRPAVTAEFKLMCGVHNLLKMFVRRRPEGEGRRLVGWRGVPTTGARLVSLAGSG